MPELYIKYKGNQPYQYRYGDEIEATILMVDGGYPTEEEDIAAYERDHTPSIEMIEVVHGRWIHDTNNLYGCSECMSRETMSPKKLKNYCPNCGAKMDG